ncbi:MAG: type II toxin-antitoxin system Phd/YefM family antitoxin [Planctomycetota bacterium]
MKRLRIAEFKARLSEHLRAVRRGESLIVMDRDNPIARVVPYETGEEPLTVRKPVGKHRSLQNVPLPPRLKIKADVVALLLEERQGER